MATDKNIKTKQGLWAKLTKLSDEELKKEGQEVDLVTKEEKPKPQKKEKRKEEALEESWLPETSEGKLSLDVYQKDGEIVVKSALAGVKPEGLEIVVDKDILTIKGERKQEEEISDKNYFHQECFWGRFSRTIILPAEVKSEAVKAYLKNGILTVILPPKRESIERKKIKIK